MTAGPHAFDRRILVATMGLFPQVLTETVYALTMRNEPAFVPTEIHVITTVAGQKAALRDLSDPNDNPLRQMAMDYGLPDLAPCLAAKNIHVIRSQTGQPLDDISDVADNVATADQIAALLLELTADPDAALHVSIAGGRKTMGFLLGYSLSLFGRPQDRLSHILVDARLESHARFFYPRPTPATLSDRAGNPVVAIPEMVSLADIPFVRLREGLPEGLLEGQASYSDVVKAADERLQPPHMEIDIAAQTLICHGQSVELGAAEFAFVALLAVTRVTQTDDEGALGWGDVGVRAYLDIYERAPRPLARTIETLLENGVDQDWFSLRVSRVNAAIRKALALGAEPYLLKSSGKRPYTKSGFDLPRSGISILDGGAVKDR